MMWRHYVFHVCCFSVVFFNWHGYANKLKSCKVLADLTSNKLNRVHDGTMGLWSFYGKAKESHSEKTTFLYNGDLIDEQGFHQGFSYHTNLASTLYPLLGATSDADEDYLEYLVLQGKAVGIDGFIVEWGYQDHPSDLILRKLAAIGLKLRKHSYLSNFCIGINWCDHWLKEHLRNGTSSQLVNAFHKNLQYLLDSFYSPYDNLTFEYQDHPVIFLFGGGLDSQEFAESLKIPLKLPFNIKEPIWIGNYLNMASTTELRQQWIELLNGTFAWVPHSFRKTPPTLSQWDTYTLPEDTVVYQYNVSQLASSLVVNRTWCFWSASASPGEDNRGCAGWGQTLKYLPRTWGQKNTYNVQWEYLMNSSANVIFIPTLNDYNEATVILPTVEYGFTSLNSTLIYSSLIKKDEPQFIGLMQPIEWFLLKKELDFLAKVREINVTESMLYLKAAAHLMADAHYANSNHFLQRVRLAINDMKQHIHTKYIEVSVPDSQMYPIYSSKNMSYPYYIDSKQQLFLQLNEPLAVILRSHNFRGILSFDYQPFLDEYSILKVKSSCNRKENGNYLSQVQGDYKVVCELMNINNAGKWKHAAVELFKENQSWDHSNLHSSDLIFLGETEESRFLIQNITLGFYISIYRDY